MVNEEGLEIQNSNADNKGKPTETTPLVDKHDVEGNQQPPSDQSRGLSVKQAAYLIAGELAGGGVLVLPKALTRTGWIGVPIIVLTCLMAAFSGKRLSDCWTLIEGRNPGLRTKRRNPYAIIAEQALGSTWSAIVSMALVITQFGISTVYLLLAAQIVEQLFLSMTPTLNICIWYLVVAGAMTPLLLFGTPKDFSFLGAIAFVCAIVACVLYFIELMSEIRPFVFRYGARSFTDFFLAVGMIMFAFGGASSFPTIQNDMADRKQFTKSLQYSFIATMALYLPIAVGGYSVLGDSAGYNFAASLSGSSLTLVGNIFMVVHLLSAFIIVINPVCQEVEELYDIPRDSLGHRTLVRLSIMLAIMFIGESIPRFYTILALVGGSTVALLTYVLPCYCYLNIVTNTVGHRYVPSTREPTPGWMKMLCWEVIVTGAVAGILATFSALAAMFGTMQQTPCYMR